LTKNDGIRDCSRTAGYAPPCHSRTYIAFDELPDENWAIAGKLLDEE
jgi:phenylpyruvate tautomerase PptA (4-oxalocrotonate tautomerase family)